MTRSRKVFALLFAMALAVGISARAYANPEGGTVAAGVVDIHVTPNVVNVHQHTDKAVIDWRSFDINADETTNFHQPNAAAVALNRVHSSQASVINGALNANGNVIIVNQNGVLFGRNARVDVNGLVATTADIDNDKFMNQATPVFDKPGNPDAAIVNQGQITARDSGLVGFVAPRVENDGVIAARLGRVHLASGDKATIDFYGDGLLEVAVSDDVRQQLVKNTGAIHADGGTIAMTAAAGNRILSSTIEAGGEVRAQAVAQRGGRIVIAGLTSKNHGVSGTVQVAGSLNTSGSSAGQKGGSITVTGDKIRLASTAQLNASGHDGGGTVKIGGDYHGQGVTPTASQLIVERGATVRNDALYNGHGGDTVLWSDGATDFAGFLSSRGGQFGGNGGFVEVSGKNFLGYRGLVDTRAPYGRNGTLLLDPANITISNLADTDISAGTPFGSTGAATSNLNVGTLVTALGMSNVIITTASGTGGAGDITFVDPVAWNSGFSLTANADRHIFVNAAITNSGTGGIFLNALAAGSNITIAAPISTAGNIALAAAQDILVNSALNAGGTLDLTTTSRDIIANASGVLTAGGALTTSSGRDTSFGANVTSGGNVTVAAARNITLAASQTLTSGATGSMSLQAAGGSTAGTGNLTLNGNLNVGTGNLTLRSGINGTRPSWTATTTNLLLQGANLAFVDIRGFLSLVINRALPSLNNVTLQATDTGGSITVNNAISGFNLSLSAANNVNVNANLTGTGSVLDLVSNAQDIVIAAGTILTSGGNITPTANRDIIIGGTLNGGALLATTSTRDILFANTSGMNVSGNVLMNSARDVTMNSSLTSGGSFTVNAGRDVTLAAGQTLTNGATSALTLSAAGGSVVGTGNLNLNGVLNAGTGGLTLVSGINGTRPNWTATATNLLRQGATFGAIDWRGFLNLTIDRDLDSSGNVSLNGNTTGSSVTVNSGRTVSGTSVSFNSNLDTIINGAVNASTTLSISSSQDIIIGATGSTNSTGASTFSATRDWLINGAVTAASLTESVTRDILMGVGSSLDVTGAITLGGRDITLADVTSGGNISATATRDLTTRASTTITNGASSNLTLYAANNVVTGTGNLTLNGILNPGSGTLNLTSGVNGTRPSYTMTTSNFIPQGASVGAVTITGFLDTIINRDITSSGNISITSFRDLTLGATYTLTPVSTGNITLAAANNVVTGTGNLYINGILNNGTGTTTLLSGINGTRPNYTLTATNFLRQGATYGAISINGFQDTTVDLDLNSNGNIAINSYRDINVNALRTLTSGNAGGIVLTAANNVVTGTGNLNLNGTLRSGTGALTLTSGVNGTRPSLTMNGTNIQRIGANYGAITISGFLDTFVNDNLVSSGTVSITSFRDLTLNALNSITTGTTGALTLRAANNVVTGTGNLYLNGTMSVGNGGLTLLSGINGTRPDYTISTTNIVPNNTNFGAVSITGFRDFTVDRNMTSTAGISINSFRDLTIAATRTVTTSGTGALSLTAANNAIGGTGNLYLNGTIGAGSGGLTLLSGINGTRPDWTATTTNLLQPGASFGVVSIQGLRDITFDRNITGTTAVTVLANRDLTINATRTVTTGATGALSIRAANGNAAGTGRLTINGNIGSGTGALTLLSGINGTRPTWTASATSLIRQGATFGNTNIQGFADFVLDRVLNSTSNVSFSNNTRVTLNNNVSSSGGGNPIAFSNPVFIAEGANVSVSSNNAAITFGSTVDDTVGGGIEGLSVNSGTAATNFTGAVNGIGLTNTAGTINFTPTAIGNTRPLQNVALTSTNGFSTPSITANGTILLRTTGAAADLTIAAGRVLTSNASGDAIVLAAGRNFLNNNGAGALVRPGGGRYIIYSTTPGADTTGGLTYDERRFSCSFAAPGTCAFNATINATVSVPATGNVFLYSNTPILLVVTPQAIANIIYGAAVPNLVGYAYEPFTLASGYLNADDFANDVITGSINGQTNYTQGSGVGSYNISYLSGELTSSLGYGFDYQTLNNAFSVLPRHVTIDLSGTAGKVYDGTNVATLTGANYTINNIYSGDLLTLGVSNSGATYNDKNVGTGKTVTVNGLALTGAVAANYVLDNTSAVAGVGSITPRALNVTGVAPNRVYDATANSSATLADDRVGGDVLTITYGTAMFGNKNVGNGKTVTINGINVAGTDAANYTFNTSTTTTADITPAALSISATGINKIYNGNTTATVSLGDNRFGGDVLVLGYGSAAFGDKNVGNGKAVNVSGITLGGADAGNYTFNTTAATTADITPRALTISATGINKVYDATTAAIVNLGDNRIGGDVLVLGYGSAAFGDKNVGNGKVVNVSGITLGGADAGNYTFNTTAATTADITPAVLTISATGINKVYDATTAATVNLGDNRIGGDVLTLGYGSALFGDKNVANGKAVNVSGITLGGADAGNYTFNTTAATTANITPAVLTISATGINKVYDATTAASVNLSDNRFGGDLLTIGYGSALFGDKNVANGKAVNVSGITLGGADAGNYTFNTTAATTADITPRALTISASGINKVYDATTAATVNLGDNRIGGDVLTLGYGSALFGNKNVGNGKAVNVSGITLGGADAGNYTFNTTAATTANITPAVLTVSATGINKVYDATTAATVNLGDNRFGGDVLTLGYGSALFGDKNVANGKAVNVSGITLGGADAGNYTFNTTAATTANITPFALTVSATASDKIYDGNANASVTLGDNRFVGDILSVSYGSASFPDKNAGPSRIVTVNGINVTGADAGNYSFNTTATTNATISPRALTIGATGINKIYDATANATVNLTDNRIGGDVLILTYGSALFGDKNVGNGKAVNVSGISLAGADAANYTYNTTAATTANITPAALTVSAAGVNKVYDGTAAAGVSITDDRFAGDVLVITYGTAAFPDKNVGNGRIITVGGINVTGADASNYTFNTSATTTADITPRALVISATGSSKIYDGNANASVILSDNRVMGDVLSIGFASALFPDKNAGTNRIITVSGITLGGADAGNYSFNSTATTTANITPATLTVTAGNQSITYGTTVPGTTLNYSGFVAGENETFLATAPTVNSLQTGIANAGTYNGNYVVGGGVDGNYSFVYVNGNLTVGKATLTVTANTQTITYGTAVPAGTLSYSGFVAGEDATYLLSAPTVNSANSGIVNAGTYANNYTVSGGTSNNYDFQYFNGNLVVTKKDLNVTADNKSITYGQSVPGGTIIYSGFVNGDDAFDLDVLPTVVSGLSGVVNAGTYTNNYTVSGGSDGNYTYHYAPGTLTVTPAGLNVTVNNQSITYGTLVPGTTITYTGFVNGDDEFDLDVLPTINSGVSGLVNAGIYTNNYTASGAVSGNYTFNYIPATLTVNKKALNVTADNRTIIYGAAVPASALSYNGFITGEDESVLISAPTLSSTQSGIVNAGVYTGNYTISGGAADNYYFNFTPGDLTVTARTLNVSAVPQTIIYGTSVPVGSITYSGFAPGDSVASLVTAPTVSSAQSGVVNAGTYVGNYTVGGGVSPNYTFVYTPADLVVTKQALTVTAGSRTITYGTTVPGTTLNYSGFVNGDDAFDLIVAPSITSAQSGVVNAGTYVGNYSVGGGVSNNYDFTYVAGTLTVNQAALNIVANNVNMVYGNGNVYGGYTATGLQLGQTIGTVDFSTNATSSSGGHWNSGSWSIGIGNASGGTFNPANYSINYVSGVLNISKRALTVTPVAANKTYDGTANASVVLGHNGLAGDNLGLSFASASFPDKQAGINRTVIVNGIALGGADANNYIAPTSATTTATIHRRALVITAVADNKLYDGSAAATVTLSDNRLAGDVFAITYSSANFPDAAAGDNRVVTVSGLLLTGADSANYSTASSITTIATIYSVLPPPPPPPPPPTTNMTPNTVVKVSQDTASVFVTAADDGVYATPSTGYVLVYLPYDAPSDNRVRNKPIRAGIGVPILEPAAFYGQIEEI